VLKRLLAIVAGIVGLGGLVVILNGSATRTPGVHSMWFGSANAAVDHGRQSAPSAMPSAEPSGVQAPAPSPSFTKGPRQPCDTISKTDLNRGGCPSGCSLEAPCGDRECFNYPPTDCGPGSKIYKQHETPAPAPTPSFGPRQPCDDLPPTPNNLGRGQCPANCSTQSHCGNPDHCNYNDGSGCPAGAAPTASGMSQAPRPRWQTVTRYQAKVGVPPSAVHRPPEGG